MRMEWIFVRHAQGEHTLHPPDSLQLPDAALTPAGVKQAQALAAVFPIGADDLLVVSPTRRTVETALCWAAANSADPHIVAHAAVGPRMFPLLSAAAALPCDQIIAPNELARRWPSVQIFSQDDAVWSTGINTLPENRFSQVADQFARWCALHCKAKIYIVSHDGTITAFRKWLGEHGVGRKDFLGETGTHRAVLSTRR